MQNFSDFIKILSLGVTNKYSEVIGKRKLATLF